MQLDQKVVRSVPCSIKRGRISLLFSIYQQMARHERNEHDADADPDGRKPHYDRQFSRRENAEYKWKHDKTVLGALEVRSEPVLDLHAKMKEHIILSDEDDFKNCLRIWDDHHLRKALIHAFEEITPRTRCCGMVTDYDATVQHNVLKLNKGWAKSVSDKYFVEEGYKMDLFVWKWANPTGKSETVILMIRFHKIVPKTG
jgi:hypothetical protein